MHKDLKIGLALGLVLVVIVGFRLATDPRLSPKARMLHLQEVTAKQGPVVSPNHDAQSEITQNNMTLSQYSYIEFPESAPAPDDLIQNEHFTDESTPVESEVINTQEKQLRINENQSEPTDVSQYVQAEKIKTQRFHIVRKDQNLSAISREYYGSANKWQKIFDANRNVLKDANKVKTGMKLIIPD